MSTDPLAYVLSCLRRAADNAYPWSLTPTEAGALAAEVARLRGERDHYRRAMEYADAEAERLREENRKLRDVLEWVNTQCPGKCAGVCDAALRGEHRREGEP